MKHNPTELVLWEDEALLVVSKPAGLPTLPDGYDPESPFLVGVLNERFGPLWVVHRLDRDTSGVIVFARTAEAHRSLNDQFAQRQVSKLYHALVSGEPDWAETRASFPLRANGDRKHRTVVDRRRGKPATTGLRVLERYGRYALLEASPHTGRRHQIRAHLAALGHAIVADPLYGDGRGVMLSRLKSGYKGSISDERPLLSRLGLHARKLILYHPEAETALSFQAPYPKDFRRTLKQLDRHRP